MKKEVKKILEKRQQNKKLSLNDMMTIVVNSKPLKKKDIKKKKTKVSIGRDTSTGDDKQEIVTEVITNPFGDKGSIEVTVNSYFRVRRIPIPKASSEVTD